MIRPLITLTAWLLAAHAAMAATHELEQVAFPALKPFNGEPVELSALMLRPAGPGPFPAVVLLHGCSGQYDSRGHLTASNRRWAELLRAQGYVALLVDSFGPRGYRSICNLQQRSILESRERAEDAYAARAWLAAQAFVQPGRIGLIGWSNGAGGALWGMREVQPHRGFGAAVAFYPGCRTLSRAKTPYKPYAPLLVLSGEADDWTPAGPCVDLTKIAKDQGAAMDIVTYPGAHHSFDRIDSPVRHRPDVRNPNQPGGRGATVGEHPQAREDALRRTIEFLERHLKN